MTDQRPVETCQVITGLDVGGAETQLTALMTRRHQAGHLDIVVSLLPGGAMRASLEAAGVKVFDLGMRPGRPSFRALVELSRLLRRHRPKVVQSWLYHADLVATLALILSGRRHNTRLFWNIRCSNMDKSRYHKLTWICARLSRLPKSIVTNTANGMQAHCDAGYRPRNSIVISNGIDTDRFRPDPVAAGAAREALGLHADQKLLIHVARVDVMKDHPTMMAALDLMGDVTLLAVGSGTEGLPEHPRLLRLGNRSDIPHLLSAANIVISSSAFGEGFSNALAEGMACGLPAVATDVGENRRLIGECGRVVAPREPGALADAVQAVFTEGVSELGERARARIEDRFGMARMVRAYDQLYEGARS